MHNIVSNFDQILDFAKQMQLPIERKRGIVREYLQTKFITTFYALPNAAKMSFVGGTSLRLLRNLPRFSEDLDFDNLGISNREIEILVSEVVRRFQAEGLKVEIRANIKKGKTYFDLRFLELLEELKITTDPKERLMIKFDYASSWKGQVTETVLLNKYGFIETVVVNCINQVLVQKLAAYVQRATTQPRDIYDVVWLYSQGATLDAGFAKKNGLEDIVQKAKSKYAAEGVSAGFKTKLTPFLFNSDELRKLDLFESVLKDLDK
jgi:predicted nucleotidyltransferase component of viral defense system